MSLEAEGSGVRATGILVMDECVAGVFESRKNRCASHRDFAERRWNPAG